MLTTSPSGGLSAAQVQALIDAAAAVAPVRVLMYSVEEFPSTSTDGTEDRLLPTGVVIIPGAVDNSGQRVVLSFTIQNVSSVTATRQIRIYFEGTPTLIWDSGVLSGAGLLSGGTFHFQVTCIRRANNQAICEVVTYSTSTSVIPQVVYTYVDADVDWDAGAAIQITGTAAGTGAAPGDITLLRGLGGNLFKGGSVIQ